MAEAKTTRRPRGPYSKGIKRRQEILDRTLEVFTKRGFEGTSLRAIGEAIGVTHAALLHYFPSREALLIEVLRERDIRSEEFTGDQPFFPGLIKTAEYNATIPGLIALYTSMLGTSIEPQSEAAREFFAKRFETGRAGIQKTLADEVVQPIAVDPEKLASLIMAAFDGLQIQWLLDPKVDIAGTLDLLRAFVPDQPAAEHP
ncbi:TetR/AcrR family transcriptional regulator [Leifsonia poae]|uniref:TetR/AcrR family transcriptional regulator n=1 Tax=Leifsonia poae TaxID=110933 RepID=UPI003D668CB6